MRSVVVLDDLMARRCARAHGLFVIGTLGILLRAKRLGILPSARPLVEQLRRSGMYLDERLLQSVLVELGE